MGVPIIRLIVFGGLYWGSSILGNYRICSEFRGGIFYIRRGLSWTLNLNTSTIMKEEPCSNSQDTTSELLTDSGCWLSRLEGHHPVWGLLTFGKVGMKEWALIVVHI